MVESWGRDYRFIIWVQLIVFHLKTKKDSSLRDFGFHEKGGEEAVFRRDEGLSASQ
jgi:hypothetical protein